MKRLLAYLFLVLGLGSFFNISGKADILLFANVKAISSMEEYFDHFKKLRKESAEYWKTHSNSVSGAI